MEGVVDVFPSLIVSSPVHPFTFKIFNQSKSSLEKLSGLVTKTTAIEIEILISSFDHFDSIFTF